MPQKIDLMAMLMKFNELLFGRIILLPARFVMLIAPALSAAAFFNSAAYFGFFLQRRGTVSQHVGAIGQERGCVRGAGDVKEMGGDVHGWNFRLSWAHLDSASSRICAFRTSGLENRFVVNEIREAAIDFDALANGKARGAVLDKFN